MKKIALMIAAASALAAPALMTSATPAAAAIDYPYCLTYAEGWSGLVERCDFSTMAQCRMSAEGLNGSCDPNRRYIQPQAVERQSHRRNRRDY